ncbi:chemotaxis protein CheW [Sansalvadorimonas sp. 2012CJ34-2]|uniref:Chemotaxis protein CheW n=1 Tax=Parendozoicomonas callyspongiae TaxID=2942213 RepID=A0ABT0PAN3_9GAMM|nr:chemotaxis protein CheW [Sansalvadorimonas sp. 2012CJ34-2]MCL6268445.1 chemotaxis protein CheW [Sansalvadorimonas sp. 2012CJ34-2]
MTRKVDQDNKQLSVMFVPLGWSHLLVPCSAIAELIAFQEPVGVENTPDWFLGEINWRDNVIPLISFEGMSGKGVSAAAPGTLYLVINRLTESDPYPFYAIPVKSVPRNLRLVADDLNWKKDQNVKEGQPLREAVVTVDGQEALIPNLIGLESMLTEYMRSPA